MTSNVEGCTITHSFPLCFRRMFLLFYLLSEGYLEQLGLSKAENRLNLIAFCKTGKITGEEKGIT